MKTPNELRLDILKREVAKFPSVAAFARQYELDVTYIRALLNGHRSLGASVLHNHHSLMTIERKL